jgi:hypothetical protein
MTAGMAGSAAPPASAVVAEPKPRPVRAGRGQDLSRPPPQAAAGGRAVSSADGFSRLRASHADREQVIEVLKAAFMQGRLSKDEFDVRVGRVLASRMYAELDAVTADIPAGVAAVPWPRTRARAWALKPAPSAANVTAWGAGVSAALAVPLGIIAVLTRHAALLELSCVAFSGAAAVAWDAMVRLAGRASLGAADALGRQHKDAIGQCERGPSRPRANQRPRPPGHHHGPCQLAFASRGAGRLQEGVSAHDRALDDPERALGRDHRDTLQAMSRVSVRVLPERVAVKTGAACRPGQPPAPSAAR